MQNIGVRVTKISSSVLSDPHDTDALAANRTNLPPCRYEHLGGTVIAVAVKSFATTFWIHFPDIGRASFRQVYLRLMLNDLIVGTIVLLISGPIAVFACQLVAENRPPSSLVPSSCRRIAPFLRVGTDLRYLFLVGESLYRGHTVGIRIFELFSLPTVLSQKRNVPVAQATPSWSRCRDAHRDHFVSEISLGKRSATLNSYLTTIGLNDVQPNGAALSPEASAEILDRLSKGDAPSINDNCMQEQEPKRTSSATSTHDNERRVAERPSWRTKSEAAGLSRKELQREIRRGIKIPLGEESQVFEIRTHHRAAPDKSGPTVKISITRYRPGPAANLYKLLADDVGLGDGKGGAPEPPPAHLLPSDMTETYAVVLEIIGRELGSQPKVMDAVHYLQNLLQEAKDKK